MVTEANGCFGCGADNPAGLKLSFSKQEDRVEATVVFGVDHAGWADIVHGGIVAAALDEAMGWAMSLLVGKNGVTSSLNVRYRRPVYIDRPLLLSARVKDSSDERVTIEASVADQRGRELATAEGQWVPVRDDRAVASRP